MTVYRDMDRAALDRAYNNGAAVPQTAAILEDWRQRSAAFRAARPALLDQAWGPAPRQAIDFFDCGKPRAPTLLFVHGGYWQYPAHSKDGFAALAEGPLALGMHVALTGYTLAPDAPLADIARQISTALDFLADLRQRVGADPARLCVAGWSAGGHLAALAQAHASVSACLAISGIFDLEPIRHSFINEKLGLVADDVARLSPLHRLPPSRAKLAVAVGALELPELRRQSAIYADACRAVGVLRAHREIAGRNHFTILDDLADANGVLAKDVAALLAG